MQRGFIPIIVIIAGTLVLIAAIIGGIYLKNPQLVTNFSSILQKSTPPPQLEKEEKKQSPPDKVLKSDLRLFDKYYPFVVVKNLSESTLKILNFQEQKTTDISSKKGIFWNPVVIDNEKILVLFRSRSENFNAPYRVLVYPLDSNEEKEIKGLSVDQPPFISPDFSKAAFVSQKKIQILDLQNYEIEEIPVDVDMYYISSSASQPLKGIGDGKIVWSSDGKSIIFANRSTGDGFAKQANDFVALDLKSKKVEQITSSSSSKKLLGLYSNRLYFVKTQNFESNDSEDKLVFIDLTAPSKDEKELFGTGGIDWQLLESLGGESIVIVQPKGSFKNFDWGVTLVNLKDFSYERIYQEILKSNILKRTDFSVLSLVGWRDQDSLLFKTSGPFASDGEYVYQYNINTKQVQLLLEAEKVVDPIGNWKKYINDDWKVSFKYPQTFNNKKINVQADDSIKIGDSLDIDVSEKANVITIRKYAMEEVKDLYAESKKRSVEFLKRAEIPLSEKITFEDKLKSTIIQKDSSNFQIFSISGKNSMRVLEFYKYGTILEYMYYNGILYEFELSFDLATVNSDELDSWVNIFNDFLKTFSVFI